MRIYCELKPSPMHGSVKKKPPNAIIFVCYTEWRKSHFTRETTLQLKFTDTVL